ATSSKGYVESVQVAKRHKVGNLYLKEAGWADGGRVIACTQPRRLAVQVDSSHVFRQVQRKDLLVMGGFFWFYLVLSHHNLLRKLVIFLECNMFPFSA
ncbi:hypothetical protein Tco_0982566, partial [Tanacetum coccineum]